MEMNQTSRLNHLQSKNCVFGGLYWWGCVPSKPGDPLWPTTFHLLRLMNGLVFRDFPQRRRWDTDAGSHVWKSTPTRKHASQLIRTPAPAHATCFHSRKEGIDYKLRIRMGLWTRTSLLETTKHRKEWFNYARSMSDILPAICCSSIHAEHRASPTAGPEHVSAGRSVRTSAQIRLQISGSSLADLSARRLVHTLSATHLMALNNGMALNNDVYSLLTSISCHSGHEFFLLELKLLKENQIRQSVSVAP